MAWKKGFNRDKGDRHPAGTKTSEIMFVDEAGKNHYKYRLAISSQYGGQRMDYRI